MQSPSLQSEHFCADEIALDSSLARFPRVHLSHLPTPCEPMESLRRHLGGGPKLYIKRDDCTGLAGGGNKTRKLEFLIGEAVAQDAEIIVTQGAVQSNHVRQTAAAARRHGMECLALLERRVPNAGDLYEKTGNILLNDIFGARYSFRPDGADMNAEMQKTGDNLIAEGRRVYVIPVGGSSPVGAAGYANCALELRRQMDEIGEKINWIVHPTGSAGTQAGLLAGLAAIDESPQVLGISVRAPKNRQVENVADLARATAALLELPADIAASDVLVDDRFVGPGYGQPSEDTIAAIELLARTEGILLDPVYSGKGFAGLIARIREGFFADDDAVVFLHTGGATALFAYPQFFSASRQSPSRN